ncbi:hypothetical protein AAF712_002669 [Marasmius tenuissimus]|uniref:Uncharacterized protein n=1 Tax=Marasmius tenuissimus TaxID=585030 RepID=A0ABR3AB08_9AGAR
MATESSVGEPFTLSSYAIPQRLSKSGKLPSTSADVYATHHKAGGGSEGYVTVAAQGDGVHVLELSTLHPIISHTLGPSTTYCCAPVSRNVSSGNDRICTTYAGIASSSDIDNEHSNRTVWSWSENLSGSIADRASQKRKAASLSHSLFGLYTCDELPSKLLASSPNGGWTLLDEDLNVLGTRKPQTSNSRLKKCFVLPRHSCRFLPSHSTPVQAAVVITILETENSLQISILAVDSNTSLFIELVETALTEQDVADVSFSTGGFLSILCKRSNLHLHLNLTALTAKSGSWSSYELKSMDNTLQAVPLADKLQLGNLSFLSSLKEAEVSIISLTSSHVLLAGFTGPTSNREIALLLWDLQFSVLLASRTIPIPSNVVSDKLAITLVDAMSSSNVLLVLTPSVSHPERRKSSGQYLRYLSLFSVANAMGRASAGIVWLTKDQSSEGPVQYDPGRRKVLSDMRSAMEKNRPQNANDAFFTWEKHELVEDAKKPAENDATLGKAVEERRIVYGYGFIKDVLNIVLRPTQLQTVTYSSQIVKHLLEKKLVSSSMLDSGLLAALRLRNDWASITQSFSSVSDLQELEIVETLRYVLARHRHTQQPTASTDGDAMQVDSVTPIQDDMSTLKEFLNLCLGYKVSPTPLRFALKRYMADVDDVACLLEVLDGWIAQWTSRELQLFPSKKLLDKNEHGVVVVKKETKKAELSLPPLTEVLFFVQTLLDVSFVNLIQNPPSHRILKRIQSRIDPEIASIDETEKLRGPLHVFAATHSKALKNAKEASEGKNAPQGDWRQRRKLAQDQAGMGIGLYQLEELTL